MHNKTKTQIGVIGAGHWGPNLIRNFHVHPNSRVVAVAELSEPRRKLISNKYPEILVTTSADEILNNPSIDAVIISTPSSTHFELTKSAILKGKHVFVEKPLATRADHCEELVNLAQKHGRTLFVGHIFVYNAGINAIKKYIDNGDLGRIYYVAMTRTNLGPVRSDVSALWDLAPHDISILEYLFSSVPVKVSAIGGRYLNAQIEDAVFATYRFNNGMLANLHVSWLNPKKVREIVLVGDKKMLVWDDMDLSSPIKIYDKSVTVEKDEALADTFMGFRATVFEGDTIIPKVKLNEPLYAECEAFLNALKEPSKSVSTGIQGKKIVDVLLATDQSLKSFGQEVSIGVPQ